MTPQPFFVCSQCGVLDPDATRVETRSQSFVVRGESLAIEMPLRLCATCGEAVNDSQLDNAMMLAIYDLYRERHQLLLPAQIVALRKRLGLSQRNLAALLGLGEVTVHRYENGALPEAAPNNLMRLMSEPGNVQILLDKGDTALDAKAKAKLQARLNTLLGANPTGTNTKGLVPDSRAHRGPATLRTKARGRSRAAAVKPTP